MDYILENVAPEVDVVPSYVTVAEQTTYAIAAMEESFNNIMESIGISELSYYTEGKVGDALKSIKDALVKFVKELWAKFTGLISNLRAKIVAFIAEKIAKIKKINEKLKGDDIKKAIEDSNDEKWKPFVAANKPLRVTKPENIAAVSLCIEKAPETYEKVVKAYVDAVKNKQITKTIDADTGEDLQMDMSLVFGAGKVIPPAAFKDNEELRKWMTDYISDKPSIQTATTTGVKKYIHDHFADSVKMVENGAKDFDKDIKKAYKSCKDGLSKVVKNSKDKDNAKILKPLFKLSKEISKVASVIVSTVQSVKLKELMWHVSVVFKALSISIGYKEKKATNESYLFGEDFSSLFNF